MTVVIRKSSERGYFDYGWLKTYHTFSFGNYQDPQHMGFRSLRVLNEDRVAPAVGFPLHSHRDMEILSIILSGGLAHQDDIGNGAILRPGYVQLMTAGRGVVHTETNASDKDEVHFLQIWIIPEERGLEPSYQEQFFPEEDKHNKWCLIASKEKKGNALVIHQDVDIYLAHLDEGGQLFQPMQERSYGWLQVIDGTINLNGVHMDTGDGASFSQIEQIEAKTAAKLLFLSLN
jgi:redox-sensitive bicupin YhaK (pirin superfamily)